MDLSNPNEEPTIVFEEDGGITIRGQLVTVDLELSERFIKLLNGCYEAAAARRLEINKGGDIKIDGVPEPDNKQVLLCMRQLVGLAPFQREEECSRCQRTKDLGQKCWWCGN